MTGAAEDHVEGPRLLDDETRRALEARARITATLRRGLDSRGFLEVETPLLALADPGEASSRPFHTYSKALDAPLHLRTTAEFHLKSLLVGGYHRVFEIARSFRDEPSDATHTLEYTLLEAYRAYDDYRGMRLLAQQLIRECAHGLLGTAAIPVPGGDGTLDLQGDWPVIDLRDAVSDVAGEQVQDADEASLRDLAHRHGLDIRSGWTADRTLLELYEMLVEPCTTGPVFYTGFPRSLTPLAQRDAAEPALAEKSDLVLFGTEIASVCTELTDPDEQRRLLEEQQPASAEDRKQPDPLFLHALEMGMPPSAGLVIGIDRLVMALTGTDDIQRVKTFPVGRQATR